VKQHGTHPTAHVDLLVALRYRMPTRPLLDLSVAGRRTEPCDTLCSVTDRILIQWCRVNHLPPTGALPQKRLVGELPVSQNRTLACPGAGGATSILPHGVHHST
jgi:hypothetical protein